MGSVSGADFTLDRAAMLPLSDQLVERLKAAIAKGRYRTGDVLPGIVELAAAADVSVEVIPSDIPPMIRGASPDVDISASFLVGA